MDEWTEIRRKVLVEGASKRSIRRDYNVGSALLDKILVNPDPPGYQMDEVRRKPVLGPHLATIDQILADDKEARPSSATQPGGSSNAYVTSMATRAAIPRSRRRSKPRRPRRRPSSRSATRPATPSSTSARPSSRSPACAARPRWA